MSGTIVGKYGSFAALVTNKKDKRFDEEYECVSDYIGPDERTKMKNDIILAKRAMRAVNAAKQKAMSDNERILKSLGKFGKTTPEECDK